MPAYVVFMRDETVDPVALAEYSAKADASFEGHAMTLLADYGPLEVLEGDKIEGAVILEFPDMDAARAWYFSPDYQATAQHRFRGARYRGFIVGGV
ncbi:DUF1330 domain-containing protein [Pseudotabrizicola sp. 4114]|uniref:DUF1330 domain-containing protein n=1 Tax=Pseudotabrizicola sp. 4114 TaxID=2817731 RepID=UPI0028620219|nr:uncharacterized protein (DUF1330 family) [Pseudorhodobacter sp. 4114]